MSLVEDDDLQKMQEEDKARKLQQKRTLVLQEAAD